ncbi:MAG: hypothetical protein R3308_03025, partial [Thiohalobacterales bacterium]|nr:hypothetical protein [Thiohalobacterales bacterium]
MDADLAQVAGIADQAITMESIQATLRAAIEQANATAGTDTISFAGEGLSDRELVFEFFDRDGELLK